MSIAQNNIANETLPDLCFVCLASNGPGRFVVAIKRGERGFFPTVYDENDPLEASRLVDRLNAKLKVTEAQKDAMLEGNRLGWNKADRQTSQEPAENMLVTNEKRVAHDPINFPKEWSGSEYLGSDGYTMHLDSGGAFDSYFEGVNMEDKNGITKALPDMCFAFIQTNAPGSYVVAIKRGELGCYKTTYDVEDPVKAKALVDHLNTEILHITPAEAEAMLVGSMFGWHVPGAQIPQKSDKIIAEEKMASFDAAVQIAETKGHSGLFKPTNQHSYSGVVIGVTEHHVVQNLGRHSIIYQTANLDVVPVVGQDVTIKILDGRGHVQPVEKKVAQEVGR